MTEQVKATQPDEAHHPSLPKRFIFHGTFDVAVTATYIGSVEIKARSPRDAREKVKELIDNGKEAVDLSFSEYSGVDPGELVEPLPEDTAYWHGSIWHKLAVAHGWHVYYDPDTGEGRVVVLNEFRQKELCSQLGINPKPARYSARYGLDSLPHFIKAILKVVRSSLGQPVDQVEQPLIEHPVAVRPDTSVSHKKLRNNIRVISDIVDDLPVDADNKPAGFLIGIRDLADGLSDLSNSLQDWADEVESRLSKLESDDK